MFSKMSCYGGLQIVLAVVIGLLESLSGTLCQKRVNKFGTLCFISVFVILMSGIYPTAASSQLSCSVVKSIFQKNGISTADILKEPITGGVCGSNTIETCCSSTSGTRLAVSARRELDNTARSHATKLAALLSSKAKRFDEAFHQLLAESRKDFHTMFTKTYGMIYEKHAHLFSGLFTELERYYKEGGVDPVKSMDGFFELLYQKMFAVLNSQYHFDDKYMVCVSEHMKEIQPFGDVPTKLASQVKRSFVATRSFTRALAASADVARNMANIRVPDSCAGPIMRSRWCGACTGHAEKACPRLCLNVARACLPQHADLSLDWDAFVDAMEKVSDRLIGPFNIAMVVEPLDIKISEAIMNFQERSQELSTWIFTECGKPILGQKPPDANYFAHPRQARSVVFKDSNSKHRESSYKLEKKENQDDFETEASFESLLKKSPFLLSNSNSKIQLSLDDSTTKLDLKPKSSLNLRLDNSNNLDEGEGRTVTASDINYDPSLRLRRDADPDPGKNSKEIEFEPYNFDEEQRGGGGRKGGRKKQGGKKKKVEFTDYSIESNSHSLGDTPLMERMVRDIRLKVRETRHTWARLPKTFCTGAQVADETKLEDNCWNGTHVDKYLPALAGEGTAALATNPELRGGAIESSSSSSEPPAAAVVTAQQFALRSITNKLKNAYNGQDVEWVVEEESASLYFGSGSGSGDSNTNDEYDPVEPGGPPDQEGDDDTEGSGHPSIPDSPKFPAKQPDQNIGDTEEEDEEKRFHKPIVIKTTSNVGSPVVPDDIEHEEVDVHMDHNSIDSTTAKESTVSGAEQNPKMSLRRALITYLFPIVCVWFGGIISEIA